MFSVSANSHHSRFFSNTDLCLLVTISVQNYLLFLAQDMVDTIQAYEQNRNQEFNRSHSKRKKVADNKLTGMLPLLPCPRLMQHLDLSHDILLFVSFHFFQEYSCQGPCSSSTNARWCTFPLLANNCLLQRTCLAFWSCMTKT